MLDCGEQACAAGYARLSGGARNQHHVVTKDTWKLALPFLKDAGFIANYNVSMARAYAVPLSTAEYEAARSGLDARLARHAVGGTLPSVSEYRLKLGEGKSAMQPA